ncbi:GGDEF domain-containing protein [Candidatus Micrarchaeota archaeon]|nr:GGDEF domain-containing protein [Candidatus Micrarchaeota archaeon]
MQKQKPLVENVNGQAKPTVGEPLGATIIKPNIRLHGVSLDTDRTPDYQSARTVHRIARMVTENFADIGEYVAMLMQEFEFARSCTVYLMPKNMDGDEIVLEHRLSVLRKEDGTFENREKGDGQNISLAPAIEGAFRERKPTLIDLNVGIRMVFEDLDMDSDDCDVYPIGRCGTKEAIAIMPFYYRNPEHPSGVVVFEGDLRCKGSELTDFARSYWTAKAAMASAAQISFLVTHKFDAITILTKAADFDVDFKGDIQEIVDRKLDTLYFVLLDLDDFKRINDRYGYSTGNEVLKRVAERIKASVRGNDKVSRWGGEEFAVILEGVSTKEEALLIAERMRFNISQINIRSPSGETVNVTCSIGVCDVASIARKVVSSGEKYENGQLVRTIFEIAFNTSDQGLKLAKKNGKDRTEFVGSCFL